MASPIRLDDRDPRIAYSGQWYDGGTSSEYEGYV